MIASIRTYTRPFQRLFRVLAPVRRAATAALPTEYGEFTIHVYQTRFTRGTHVALVCGEIGSGHNVLTRVHSTCLTGGIFHSARCDCGAQLQTALRHISDEGRGVLLYLNQERSGISLVNTVRAYTLQDQGFDTVKANERLGFSADSRDYRVGVQILRDLGVRSTRLPPLLPAAGTSARSRTSSDVLSSI